MRFKTDWGGKSPHAPPTRLPAVPSHPLRGLWAGCRGTTRAQQDSDNYALNFWLEVITHPANKKAEPEGPASLTGRSSDVAREAPGDIL